MQVQVVDQTTYPPKCHCFVGLDRQIGSSPPAVQYKFTVERFNRSPENHKFYICSDGTHTSVSYLYLYFIFIYIYTVYIYIDLSLIILHIESVGFRCRPVCQGTTSPNLQAFTLVVPRDSSGRYVKTFALGWWFQIYSLSIPGIIAIYSHPKTIEKQHSARMVINYMLCSWCYNAMRVSKFHHSPKMGWVILNDQVGTVLYSCGD
jgi:hypothetical protein